MPKKICIDGSPANKAAVVAVKAALAIAIELRQIKYLNNRFEQDYRAVKRITQPMLGFKSFSCVRTLLSSIETMHMIKKGQLNGRRCCIN